MLQYVFFLYTITHHSCAAKTETSTFSAASVLEGMELPPSTSLLWKPSPTIPLSLRIQALMINMFLNHSRIGAVIKLCKVMFGPESNFIFATL